MVLMIKLTLGSGARLGTSSQENQALASVRVQICENYSMH